MADKHMRRWSTLLAIKEMQNTLKYHDTPIRIAKTKIMTPPMGGEDHSYNAGGNVKWYSHSGKWLSNLVSLKFSFFKN